MDLGTISDNIENNNDLLGKKALMGLPLESCDPRFLDISDENLNEHVSMQPSALAFWGSCYKDSLRKYERIKRDYESWRRVEGLKMKQNSTNKMTKDDTEASIDIKHADEVKKWLQIMDNAEDQADLFDSYYKAWHQKGFSMRAHADIAENDLQSSGSLNYNGKSNFPSIQENPNKETQAERMARIRAMIRDNKKGGEGEDSQ